MPRGRDARGLANLGRAIDQRKASNTNKLVYQQDLGQAVSGPFCGSTAAGTGGNANTSAGVAFPVVLFVPGISFVPMTLSVGEEVEIAPFQFHTAKWPAGVSLAQVRAEPQTEAFIPITNLARSCSCFSWVSEGDGLSVTSGAAASLGFACAKAWHASARSKLAFVRACVRINDTDRFSAVHLVLNDVDIDDEPGGRAAVDLLPGLQNNEWMEVVLSATGTDIGSWGDFLRVGLFAMGTESYANVGPTEFAVAWLQIELWPG